MKLLLLFIGEIFISQKAFARQADTKIDTSFTLSYISIGLGSYMWTMQPMFRVKGSEFTYTLEEAWQFKDSEKPKAGLEGLAAGTVLFHNRFGKAAITQIRKTGVTYIITFKQENGPIRRMA